MTEKPATCRALIKDYCENCSFAGVHFIADDTKHLTERLLWLILVILSWYGSALLIVAAWDSFVKNPISFGVETTYINWDTKMPTVAICEIANDERIYNVADDLWTPDHSYDLDDVLKGIAFLREQTHSLVEICYKSDEIDPNCPMSNFRYYAYLIRQECHQVIKNCSFNGQEFSCCDFFQNIETDMGTCFILNSLQIRNPKFYPMVTNIKQKTGVLRFETVSSDTMLYTIGEDEVPSITTLRSSTLMLPIGYSYRREVSVRNIENDPQIVDTTTEQRACRFNNESTDELYPQYSYSACTVKCRKQAQLDMCGCNDHFMPMTADSDRCNISGAVCLSENTQFLNSLKPVWDSRPGLVCDCLPSCNEMEITVIKDIANRIKVKANRNKAIVEVVLARYATERFKRNVVRSRLDLVVSVGGTTGLFVGASLLSFVELIFYFTIRFFSNILMNKIQRNKVEVKLAKRKITFRQEIRENASEHVVVDRNNGLIRFSYDHNIEL